MPFTHLDTVVETVDALAQRFRTNGYRLFLVGGIVRDQWLDHDVDDSSDIDLTTDAHPAAIKDMVADLATALWTQGERFGTIGLRFDGRAIEITTHRAEEYDPDSRKPEVDFGESIDGDLSRRDFTVNAMAYEVPQGTLVDPFGGAADLEAKRLRTPLSPERSFRDDPLRMLRAARFAARLSLTPDAGLVQAATELRSRLRIVAIERIGDEIERLFALPDPSVGVAFLIETGLADELLGWKLDDATPIDPASSDAIVASVGAVADSDWRIRLAAFLLAAIETPGEIDDTVARLRLSRDDQRGVVWVTTAAARIDDLDATSRPQLRRWVASAPSPWASLDVARALAVGHSTSVAQTDAVNLALTELERDEGLGAPPLLDGRDIMALVDQDAGPIIGEAVDMLRNEMFEQGPLSEQAQTELVSAWWVARSASR